MVGMDLGAASLHDVLVHPLGLGYNTSPVAAEPDCLGISLT